MGLLILLENQRRTYREVRPVLSEKLGNGAINLCFSYFERRCQGADVKGSISFKLGEDV